MKILVHMLRSLFVAFCVFLFTGCQDPEFKNIDINVLTTPSKPANISTDGKNTMFAYTSVAIALKPISKNNEKYKVIDKIDVVSQDEDILLVTQASRLNVFVLTGLATGQASMEVSINGAVKDYIDIQVLE